MFWIVFIHRYKWIKCRCREKWYLICRGLEMQHPQCISLIYESIMHDHTANSHKQVHYSYTPTPWPWYTHPRLLHLHDLPTLYLVDIPRHRHVQHKLVLLDQRNVVPHTLLQVLERQEGIMVRVLAQLVSDLAPDVGIREGEHAAVGLAMLARTQDMRGGYGRRT